jgi:uncharacterized membrane protein YphA (DoxX/SURF4 family)
MIIVKKILAYLVGLVFILSALTKLLTIDSFEMFLYSFGFFKLNHIMILSRVLIGAELVIGIIFLLRIYVKPLSYFTLVILFLFTAFIVYLELSPSKEDCHCFGTIIRLSNIASIIKNIVLAGIVIVLLKADIELSLKHKLRFLTVGIVLGYGVAFGVHPPDFMLASKYAEKNTYCEPCFEEFVAEKNITDKKVVICFFSTTCKYCKLGAKKISLISQKAKNTENILYVFHESKNTPEAFFTKTRTTAFNWEKMKVGKFLKLTKGKMPLVILYNKGVVEKIYAYRDINEDELLEFLKD